MAKEDFCFTYYDGDATRDMQHMDRLCRGAYTDLIIMQRKVPRGRLTMDHIRAVLGKDFEVCWYSIEIVLKKDEDGYYIEWVETSLQNMREGSKKQSEKARKRWEKEKSDKNAAAQNKDAAALKNDAVGMPLENGSGNGEEGKGGAGGKQIMIGSEMQKIFIHDHPNYPNMPGKDIPAMIQFADAIAGNLGITNRFTGFTEDEKGTILREWGRISTWLKTNRNNKSLEYLAMFKIQEILSSVKDQGNNSKNGSSGKKSNLGSKSGGFAILTEAQREAGLL